MNFTQQLRPLTCAWFLLSAALHAATPGSQSITLEPISTVNATTPGTSAAEIVAHDPTTQRLFVVNAVSAQIDAFQISDPAKPKRLWSINVKPYGAVANSVAIKNGMLAVAVEAPVKTDPGQVVFFNSFNRRFLGKEPSGALPDMVTFSPDGRYVLVANEGEPNDAYTVDPEGSVTIIDVWLPSGAPGRVRTARFTQYNGAVPPGVRIFGPGASAAQDIEPEYITVSADSTTAWVTCQENNAIATIDLASATVTSLVPLGFKDHSAVAAAVTIHQFDEAQLPPIGTTLGGQEINLGGFSGLSFEGIDPVSNRYKFIAHTDRGPNAEPTGIRRPFLLPSFVPEIVRFELNPNSGQLTVTQRIALQRAAGVPLSGLPNTAINDDPNAAYNDEKPVDLLGAPLPLDPFGADLEGIAVDGADGSFWMVDEYRPAIYHFTSAGVLIERLIPIGTAAAAGAAPGTFGTEVLPAVLAQRRQNRGFEAVALDNGKVFAFVQSPVRNPTTLNNAALTALRNVRIVEFDPVTRLTRQFIYVMDNADLGAGANTRADKIGDAASFGNGEFLVVERDDDKLPADPLATIEKKIYRFNLSGATDVTTRTGLIGSTGKTVDELSISELVANGIRPVQKVLHVDLATAGYNQVEKVEGLAIIDPWTIAVLNDNDFGVANITINSDGTFTRNAPPEPVQLGIIDLRFNALDASDRDNKINIRQWPIKGVYMPDAIASYVVGGEEYLITANEGDAREYTGFSEILRIGSNSIPLDPVKFPHGAALKDLANLGRLNVTSTLGKNPASGLYEELYAFGSRSFSIWNRSGALVFDSADDFELITAQVYPANFNASNSSNDFDNRSDDKGPEPEGVAIGEISGRTYAFIALERIGGIMVYDVSDPQSPLFVDYANNRDFTKPVTDMRSGDLGPEGIIFISAANSPNGKPLLVVANEISGTTTIFEVNTINVAQ